MSPQALPTVNVAGCLILFHYMYAHIDIVNVKFLFSLHVLILHLIMWVFDFLSLSLSIISRPLAISAHIFFMPWHRLGRFTVSPPLMWELLNGYAGHQDHRGKWDTYAHCHAFLFCVVWLIKNLSWSLWEFMCQSHSFSPSFRDAPSLRELLPADWNIDPAQVPILLINSSGSAPLCEYLWVCKHGKGYPSPFFLHS